MEKLRLTDVLVFVPVNVADCPVSVPQKNPDREADVHGGMVWLSIKKPLDPLSKKAVRLELSL